MPNSKTMSASMIRLPIQLAKYQKMDVSCEKKATEHKTCSWAEEVICKALHVSPRELNRAVAAKLSKHPPLRMGNKNGPKRGRHHGYHLEKAKYIVELILLREKESGAMSLPTET